jgi:hypothetical protein
MEEQRYTLEEIKSAFMYAFLFEHETEEVLDEAWRDLERNLLTSDEYMEKYHSGKGGFGAAEAHHALTGE